jgi:hypothetical protein
MTGLKSGSGDDLWSDETSANSEEDTGDSKPTATDKEEQSNEPANTTGESRSENKTSATKRESTVQEQPYIIRRAIQDKSVQFERDERLTFFVHDDVIEGERRLLTEVEGEFGRDVPKFDVREAVYRAALQNPEDIINELIEMGYSPNKEG